MNEFSKEIISEEMIFLNEGFSHQDEIINFLVDNAYANNYITDRGGFFEAVKKREDAIPTAIGYSIAMPHGKNEAVNNPFIAFARTKNEIRWSQKSDEKVQLIFLIGVPENGQGKLHLKFISQLSKKLLDETFRKNLLTKNSSSEIFRELKSIDI